MGVRKEEEQGEADSCSMRNILAGGEELRRGLCTSLGGDVENSTGS